MKLFATTGDWALKDAVLYVMVGTHVGAQRSARHHAIAKLTGNPLTRHRSVNTNAMG